MMMKKRPAWLILTAAIAVIFGVMTIKSGASVLFFDSEARVAAGNYVDFVLWFNFSTGFFYVVTGIGIWLEKTWATTAALVLAVLTLLVFIAFGIHVLNAGEYEQRTVVAMSLRTSVWFAIAITLWQQQKNKNIIAT